MFEKWQHPALEALFDSSRRKDFTENTLKVLIYNAGMLVLFIWVGNIVNASWINGYMQDDYPQIWQLVYYIYIGCEIVMSINIADAVWRYYRPGTVDFASPLTPNQKKLLGIQNDANTPSTGSYITPPRMAKTNASATPVGYNSEKSTPSPFLSATRNGKYRRSLGVETLARRSSLESFLSS